MDRLFKMEGPIYFILYRMVELVLLNFLFIIFSIPIFTIGASTTALYSVTMKLVKNEGSSVLKLFVQAFKKNFKQSTIIWIAFLVIGMILMLDFSLLKTYEGHLSFVILLCWLFFTILYVLLLTLIFPYISMFNNTMKESIGNVLKMAVANPYYTIMTLSFGVGPFVLMFLTPTFFVSMLYLNIFISFSLIAYINSFFLRKIYGKYHHSLK